MPLEILYDTATNEVRAWCADPSQFGNFLPRQDQAVVIWDTQIPNYDADTYHVNLQDQTITGIPIIPHPDVLRAQELLATSPNVITQPEIWELLRIIGKRLGYYHD